MTTIAGTVLTISQVPLGDVLAADATGGDTSITVDDAADFAEGGGTILIGGQLNDYISVDDDTGVMVLVDALSNDAASGDRVDLADPDGSAALEWQALVAPAGTVDVDEAVQATISYALIPLLPEGIRDPGTGESVTLTLDGSEWQVTNVHGQQPNVEGDNLDGGAVTVGNTSGASSPAVAITSTAGSASGSQADGGNVAIGPGSNASGDGNNNVAIGNGAFSGGSESVAIGNQAAAGGDDSISIGTGSAGANGAISIGDNGAFGVSSIAIGGQTHGSVVQAFDDGSIAIGTHDGGTGAQAHGEDSIAMSVGSSTNGTAAIAVGKGATAGADGAVAFGCDSSGTGASAAGVDDFALGTGNHKVSVPGLFGVHGATPVGQSATPTTLADVIAILQSHGFCA